MTSNPRRPTEPLALLDPDWRLKANCRNTFDDGPLLVDPFFPESLNEDGKLTDKQIREYLRYASIICSECPVRAECEYTARQYNEKFGIWGGMSFQRTRSNRRAS